MLQATRVTDRARHWLDVRGSGTVHSLFRRVCNLYWGGWLIPLHTAATGGLPGGIEVEGDLDFSGLGLVPGDKAVWAADQQCVYVGRHALTLGRAATLSMAAAPAAELPSPGLLQVRRGQLLRQLTAQGRGLLGAQVTHQRANDGDTMQGSAARAAWARGTSLCESLSSGDETAIRRGVAALLGLGEGLTPSGDDLILGLMAVLTYGRQGLRQPLAACAGRLSEAVYDLAPHATTQISANYLRLGVLGEYSERLNHAARALMSGATGAETEPVILALLHSGHSSGTDTAVGLYLGMAVYMAQQRQASFREVMQQ